MSSTKHSLSFGWVSVIGISAIVLGFVALLVSSVSEVLSLTRTFLTLVGLFALVQGLRYTIAGKNTERTHVAVGDPEQRVSVPTPGADITKAVLESTGGGRSVANNRRKLRNRLRALAVNSLVAQTARTEQAATKQIDTGEWPEDRLASAFLSNTAYPPQTRIRAVLLRRSLHRDAIDRTVDAIDELWGEENTHEKQLQNGGR